MAQTYDVGDSTTWQATFRNSAGVLTDPTTVIASSMSPSGQVTPQTVTHVSIGIYSISFVVDTGGRWYWSFKGTTGALVQDIEGSFDVNTSAFTTGTTTGFVRPSVDEVGQRMYARTMDSNGNRIGTFNALTTPTDVQCGRMIDDAAALVSAEFGASVPIGLWPLLRYAIICRTAMGIERGFFPEATQVQDSGYFAWKDEYDACVLAMTTALEGDQPNQVKFGSIPLVNPNTTIGIGDQSGGQFGWWYWRDYLTSIGYFPQNWMNSGGW